MLAFHLVELVVCLIQLVLLASTRTESHALDCVAPGTHIPPLTAVSTTINKSSFDLVFTQLAGLGDLGLPSVAMH